MKNSFVLYTDYQEHIALLTLEEKGILFDALFKYAQGEEVELDGMVKMAFSFIKAQMDRDNEKYQRICEMRKEIGAKGGLAKATKSYQKLPKATKSYQSLANVADTDTDNDTETDTDNDTDIKGINYQEIVNMYNLICLSLPKVSKLSEARKKTIKARLNKYTLEDLKKAFLMAEQSDFLKGSNNRNWSANFDWIMNDTNLAKILDGNYINKTNKKIEIDSNFRNFLADNQVVDWEAKDGDVS